MTYTLEELYPSGEGESDGVNQTDRRVWQMFGDPLGVPGLPPAQAIRDNPTSFGLPDYRTQHPRSSRTLKLDRYQVEVQSQKSYLIIGLHSSNGRWRLPDQNPIAVDGSLWSYTSDYIRKSIPTAHLEQVKIPLLTTLPPLEVRHIWQPDAPFTRAGATQDHWVMRRSSVVLTAFDRNLIRRQQNRVHRVNFDGEIGYYKFTGSFDQVNNDLPALYNLKYEWIGDTGAQGELSTDAEPQLLFDPSTGKSYEATAWPGKMPKGFVAPEPPYWFNFDGQLWEIPPFHQALSIAPTPLISVSGTEPTDPDENPPVFSRIPMFRFDPLGWSGLPWLSDG